MIEDWVGKKIEVKLLYKASIHGDRSADFHNKCDNKGPTICFMETMIGVRFGDSLISTGISLEPQKK
jgi:hypothetical protein